MISKLKHMIWPIIGAVIGTLVVIVMRDDQPISFIAIMELFLGIFVVITIAMVLLYVIFKFFYD